MTDQTIEQRLAAAERALAAAVEPRQGSVGCQVPEPDAVAAYERLNGVGSWPGACQARVGSADQAHRHLNGWAQDPDAKLTRRERATGHTYVSPQRAAERAAERAAITAVRVESAIARNR